MKFTLARSLKVPRCELTGKSVVVKNLVSHSNIKTKSRAFPNVQYKKFFSEQLNESARFNVAVSTIRDIDKYGSFDNFIMKQPLEKLSTRALKFKKRILKKMSKPKKITQKKSQEKKDEVKN